MEEESDVSKVGDAESSTELKSQNISNLKEPIQVIYCPKCTWPPEYCEYGVSPAECRTWILDNCPEILGETELVRKMGDASLGDDEADEEGEDKKKSKRGGVGVPRKKAAASTAAIKVIISRVQRQKRKFVTVICGLESVPDLKIKDVSKACGKKFSSGASVGDTVTGGKEIVIQGDVYFEVPTFLITEFKVSPSHIFLQNEDNTVQPYA